MASVVLKNVYKRFGDVIAVDNLSIEIEDREFAVLVGSSGCGKTTALRMIAGLEKATSGDIYIGDARVNDLEPRERDIAMVFQNYALYPHMSVRENMGFGLQIRKVEAQEIAARVDEASDILGIRDLLDRRPKELSGGQRQRVAVGRAIVRKPKVFLFDEPLSNLDAKLRVAMRAEISKLHRRLGATMIYVTHDQVEAMTMADRIFIMSRGVLQQSGTPMEVYAQPVNRFVAGFIGSPAMNFIAATLRPSEDGLWIDADSFRVRVPEASRATLAAYQDRAVVFGVRPEDIALHDPANGADAGNVMHARAEVVETLGSEIFLHLASGSHALVARMPVPERMVQVGEDVQLEIKMLRTHVFDTAQEMTLV